jgi:hypothetical protein
LYSPSVDVKSMLSAIGASQERRVPKMWVLEERRRELCKSRKKQKHFAQYNLSAMRMIVEASRFSLLHY